MSKWDKEIERAKKEKDQFFRVKIVEIKKPPKKIRFKDGHEVQEMTPRNRSLTKKAQFAEKVKRMTDSKVHNLTKRERLIDDLSEKIRMAHKFEVISTQAREDLDQALFNRDYDKFKSLCSRMIVKIYIPSLTKGKAVSNVEENNATRLATILDCMKELESVH